MYVGAQYLLRTLTWLKSVAWSHLLTVAAKFLCSITHVATISSCVCGSFAKFLMRLDILTNIAGLI